MEAIRFLVEIAERNGLYIEKMAYHIQPNSLFDRLDEEILDPLISYDREKSANLTETLYVYLKYFFNLQKSSSELFVHPNTNKSICLEPF